MIKTINVTQECIDNGIPSRCRKCPVAIAVKKVVTADISVVPSQIYFWIRSKDHVSQLSRNVAKFIYDFDSGKKVKPFKFKLDIPDRFF